MPGAGDYLFYQRHYTQKCTDANILATTDYSAGNGTAVLSAKSANHQLFIQKISVSVTTYSAKTWTFQDSAGTPVPGAVGSIPAAAPTTAGDAQFVWDFGPKGWPLTIATNLLLKMSAAGAAAQVHIEAYEKIGQTIAYDSGASKQ